MTVISGADAEVPVDTAEVSATLNNELVDSATLTGRNAAELIKMMPGVTFNNFGANGSGYNSQITGTNNGPAGSFSANGTQPYGSTAVMLDGANLVDPGNAGTQIANINQDMTDSVKYLSASYGAEYAKGPAVLQAFSKSGGQKYHGEGYLYARNTAVGYANDWYAKNQDLGNKPNPYAAELLLHRRQRGRSDLLPALQQEQGQAVLLGRLREDDSAPLQLAGGDERSHRCSEGGDFTNHGRPLGVYNPAINTAISQRLRICLATR